MLEFEASYLPFESLFKYFASVRYDNPQYTQAALPPLTAAVSFHEVLYPR